MKKLAVKRETLRLLAGIDLRRAHGGVFTDGDTTGCSVGCPGGATWQWRCMPPPPTEENTCPPETSGMLSMCGACP